MIIRRKKYLLLISFTITLITLISLKDTNDFESSSDQFKKLLKFFTSNDLFILDIEQLENIKFDSHVDTSNLTENSYTIKKLSKLTNFKNDLLFTFGVENYSMINLRKKLNIFKPICVINDLKNIYIKCNQYEFQIVVLYPRGDFYWIDSDDYDTKNRKYFGDTPRALNKFNLVLLIDSDLNVFKVTNNIKRLLFDYDHSKFIECNRTLAMRNLIIDNRKYEQNLEKNAKVKFSLEYLSKSLESYYKHFWLAGGTLLGWYRDCGFIPFTQDADFGLWDHEYESILRKHFLGNKHIHLVLILGLEHNMYEFRIQDGYFTFDLFFTNKENSTYQTCGYHYNRFRYKRLLPEFSKVCSAELFDHKYMIPCDPVGYLNFEYGGSNGWLTPKSKGYSWKNMIEQGEWSDTDWPHVYKSFYSNGKINVVYTLKQLNKFSNFNFTKLPFDLE